MFNFKSIERTPPAAARAQERGSHCINNLYFIPPSTWFIIYSFFTFISRHHFASLLSTALIANNYLTDIEIVVMPTIPHKQKRAQKKVKRAGSCTPHFSLQTEI
jgi:TRAP-type C4-dicarboxylate transport system permease large subunit